MKDSAVMQEARPDGDSSAFQRFAKAMRALVAVPKRELEEKLSDDKAKRHVESRTRKA